MSEWLKELAWKAGIRGTVSGVRIPLSPPENFINLSLGLAVLDGEIAVPCNLQSALAGLNSCLRLRVCEAGRSKWC